METICSRMESFVANREDSVKSRKEATLPIWRLIFSSPVSFALLMHSEYWGTAAYPSGHGITENQNEILHVGLGQLIRVQQREKNELPYKGLLVCACLLFWEDTQNIQTPNASTDSPLVSYHCCIVWCTSSSLTPGKETIENDLSPFSPPVM